MYSGASIQIDHHVRSVCTSRSRLVYGLSPCALVYQTKIGNRHLMRLHYKTQWNSLHQINKLGDLLSSTFASTLYMICCENRYSVMIPDNYNVVWHDRGLSFSIRFQDHDNDAPRPFKSYPRPLLWFISNSITQSSSSTKHFYKKYMFKITRTKGNIWAQNWRDGDG